MSFRHSLHAVLSISLLCLQTAVGLAQDAPGKKDSANSPSKLSVKQVARLGTRRYRHGSTIRALWFTPERRLVSAGGLKFRAWDTDTGEMLSSVPREQYARGFFDGDSRVLIAEPLRNGVKTHSFRVVDLSTGRVLARWKRPKWVIKAAMVPGADFAVLGNLNRTISIVDLKTGEERDRIEYIGPKSNEAGRPYVSLSPDGSQLAVQVRRNYVRFYSLAENGKVNRLLSTIESYFNHVVFSSRPGEAALLGNRTSSLWNTRTGKKVIEWPHPGPNWPSDAVFSPSGREVATLSDNVVRVTDTKTGKPLRNFAVPAMPRVDHLAISADGTRLAAGGYEGRMRLFDFATGREIGFDADAETRGPAESVAISDDGKWIASAEYKGVVSLWDGANSWRRRVLKDDDIRGPAVYDTSAGPNFVTFVPEKVKLLAGSSRYHNSVNLWDAASGQRETRFRGHGAPITGVVTSRDGSVIVSSSRGSTRTWNAAGKPLAAKFTRSNSVAVSLDGKLVAIPTRRVFSQGQDSIPEPSLSVPVVELYDISSGKMLRSMSHATSEIYGIYSVSFSPDGRLLAGMAKDGRYVWEVATGKRLRLFPVPQPKHEPFWHAPVRGCAFSPTENIVAVPTGDGEIYFVDANASTDGEWKLAITKGHDGPVKAVSWRRDGRQLVSGGSDSTIVLWDVSLR